MGRLLAVLLAWIVSVSAWADALILIRPDEAGPLVPRGIDTHPLWVRWPQAAGKGENRVFSLLAGVDLVAGPTLPRSGYAEWTRKRLGGQPRLLPGSTGGVLPDLVKAVEAIGGPEGPLIVAEAHSWEEVRKIASEHGRTLALEYPPPDGAGHAWQFGEGWPSGVPTASGRETGWIEAREAVDLLRKPETFRWASARPVLPIRHWQAAPVRAKVDLIGTFVVLGVLAGLWIAVSQERRARGLSVATDAVLLLPAAAVTGPALFPGEPTVVPTLGVLFPLVLVSRAARPWLERHGLPSRLAMAVIGLLVAICPSGSLLSRWYDDPPLFGAPFAFGALVATLAALAALGPAPPSRWIWVGRAGVAALIALIWPHRAAYGLDDVTILLCPVIALVAGEGWLKWPFWALLVLRPDAWERVWKQGVAFRWEGLATSVDQARAVDLAPAVRSIYALPTAAMVLSVLMWLFADPFSRRPIRRSAKRCTCLWQAAGATTAFVFPVPSAWPVAGMTILSALILTVADAADEG